MECITLHHHSHVQDAWLRAKSAPTVRCVFSVRYLPLFRRMIFAHAILARIWTRQHSSVCHAIQDVLRAQKHNALNVLMQLT